MKRQLIEYSSFFIIFFFFSREILSFENNLLYEQQKLSADNDPELLGTLATTLTVKSECLYLPVIVRPKQLKALKDLAKRTK